MCMRTCTDEDFGGDEDGSDSDDDGTTAGAHSKSGSKPPAKTVNKPPEVVEIEDDDTEPEDDGNAKTIEVDSDNSDDSDDADSDEDEAEFEGVEFVEEEDISLLMEEDGVHEMIAEVKSKGRRRRGAAASAEGPSAKKAKHSG